MAVTPAILLAKLQGLHISTEVITHPAVRTVEVRLGPASCREFSSAGSNSRYACWDAGSQSVYWSGPRSRRQKPVFEGIEHSKSCLHRDANGICSSVVASQQCCTCLMQDKRNRLFLVSAAASTKVDLKGWQAKCLTAHGACVRCVQHYKLCLYCAALGLRLGVPKPGIRMAPEELLESVLGVCVLILARVWSHCFPRIVRTMQLVRGPLNLCLWCLLVADNADWVVLRFA